MLGGALAAAFTIPSNARADELRIGFIAPMTGLFAQVGKDMVNGFQMYLDEHGGKLGGMDVKFIVEDDQAKPDLGVTKAKKLILQDKVHMFVGGVLASTGYALAPVSTAEKTIYIPSIPAADDLTQREAGKYPYLIRTGWTSSQPNHPYGQWACDQGYKKIVIVAADYAFGYEQAGGFQKAFEDCGGKIVQKIWPPLGNKDFGPFIPTIKADADAVFSTDGGTDGGAIPQANCARPATRSQSSAAAPAMTNSLCPSWATRWSATCPRCNTAPRSTRRRTRPSSRRTAPSTARCVLLFGNNYTTAQMIDDVMKRPARRVAGRG